MRKIQFFGMLFGAILSATMYAQENISTESKSPLLILSSLYTAYERGVPIPMHVACHSRVLRKCIQGAHLDQLGVPVPLGIGSYSPDEFALLGTVLTAIHQTPSDKKTITALRTFIEDENVLTLAVLADRGAFDIPELRTAIEEDFGSMLRMSLRMHHEDCLLVNQLIQKSKDAYRKKSVIACAGQRALCAIIDSAQATARQKYLGSEGLQRDIFFSGVSYADLARYDLVSMQRVVRNFEEYLVMIPRGACRLVDIVSLDGLVCGSGWDKRQQLLISKTSVEKLPKRCFKETSSLMSRIFLLNNKIKEIDVDAFESCTQLTALDISGNPIKKLPDKFLVPWCKRLMYLNLSDNKIEAISKHTFESTTLRHLVLANNALTYIDAHMFTKCTPLAILNISDNPIPIEVINAFRVARPDIKIVF